MNCGYGRGHEKVGWGGEKKLLESRCLRSVRRVWSEGILAYFGTADYIVKE